MTFELDKIFLPSVGVDIVFNMNSLVPYSRSSIIYDVDFKKKEIIIAQPLSPFSKNTVFKELHLTTITRENARKIRVGIECVQFKIIDDYALANRAKVAAVLIRYDLPVQETNIRSAFRLPLSTKYIIKGKILYNGLEYFTSRDFSIRDVSLAGFGILIPKKRNQNLNPLMNIKTKEDFIIGIVLLNMDEDKPMGTLPLKVQVIRHNTAYSDTHSLMGLKILSLKSKGELILNKFIHEAQIAELKRLSQRNL